MRLHSVQLHGGIRNHPPQGYSGEENSMKLHERIKYNGYYIKKLASNNYLVTGKHGKEIKNCEDLEDAKYTIEQRFE